MLPFYLPMAKDTCRQELHGADCKCIMQRGQEADTESPHAAATPMMARVRKWTAMSLCRGNNGKWDTGIREAASWETGYGIQDGVRDGRSVYPSSRVSPEVYARECS